MNAMRYQSEILYNVRSVLCRVRDRGGKFSKSFVMQEYARFQGERAAIVLNVALKAGGSKSIAYPNDGLMDTERDRLIERAQSENQDVLAEIKRLREASK